MQTELLCRQLLRYLLGYLLRYLLSYLLRHYLGLDRIDLLERIHQRILEQGILLCKRVLLQERILQAGRDQRIGIAQAQWVLQPGILLPGVVLLLRLRIDSAISWDTGVTLLSKLGIARTLQQRVDSRCLGQTERGRYSLVGP